MKLTGTLILKVNYEDLTPESGATDRRTENIALIERLLCSLANHAADNGLMSGETDLTVDWWESKVEVT